MTITTLLDPTQMPSPDDDQIPFDNKMAAVLRALPQFGAEVNATAANLNSIAAGGAYAIPYNWGATVNSAIGFAPGGFIALSDGVNNSNSTTPANAVNLFLDTKDSVGASVAGMITSFFDSTSSKPGTVRIQKVGDPSKWLVFSLTGSGASPTAYYKYVGISYIGGSSASPFTPGDAVMLFFQRTGDKGDIGATGAPAAHTLLSSYTVSTAVAQIDFLNLFSDTYDRYVIDVQGLTSATAGTDQLQMRLAIGGAITAASYGAMTAPAPGTPSTGASALAIGGGVNSSGNTNADVTGTIEVRNARSTTRLKSIGFRGRAGASVYGTEGASDFTSAVSGFRLYFSSANINGGTVRVFGIKNT